MKTIDSQGYLKSLSGGGWEGLLGVIRGSTYGNSGEKRHCEADPRHGPNTRDIGPEQVWRRFTDGGVGNHCITQRHFTTVPGNHLCTYIYTYMHTSQGYQGLSGL